MRISIFDITPENAANLREAFFPRRKKNESKGFLLKKLPTRFEMTDNLMAEIRAQMAERALRVLVSLLLYWVVSLILCKIYAREIVHFHLEWIKFAKYFPFLLGLLGVFLPYQKQKKLVLERDFTIHRAKLIDARKTFPLFDFLGFFFGFFQYFFAFLFYRKARRPQYALSFQDGLYGRISKKQYSDWESRYPYGEYCYLVFLGAEQRVATLTFPVKYYKKKGIELEVDGW